MDLQNQYIEPDNSYHQPSHDPSGGTMVLVVTLTIISVVLTSVLAVVYYSKKNNPGTDVTSGTMINSGDWNWRISLEMFTWGVALARRSRPA